ncbi:MAG: hypothetical protein JJU20_03740 [Opitutales bacterium]|nr:hypothetical protein [Opitutales bacterium]
MINLFRGHFQFASVFSAALCCFVAASAGGDGPSSIDKEFSMLKDRLSSLYFAEVDEEAVFDSISMLGDDGRFLDLEYDGYAPFREHLLRVTDWARYFAADGTGSAEVYSYIERAMSWWLTEDYIDPNWWWTYIGYPELLSPITVLVGDELKKTQPTVFRNLVAYHDRSYVHSQSTPRGGGANLADMSFYAMVGAVYSGNARRMEQILERGFKPVVRWVGQEETVDGFRRDGTMLAHGPQLYNATYGRELLNSASRAMVILYGSRWALPSEMVEIVEDQVLLGIEPFTYGNWFDYNAAGRAVSRPVSASLGIGFIPVVERLLQMNPREPARLKRLLERLQEDRFDGENHFSGTQAFWVGEILTHMRSDYYSSVRLISNRTRRNEVLNDEGLKNRFFGDGVQFTLVHGDEYDDLPAVWDYARLPGVTAPRDVSLEPLVRLGEPGTAAYAGVLSSGREGVAAMELNTAGLKGWKSWFVMEEGIVALGSNLTAGGESEESPIATSLNQKRALGDILSGDSSGRTDNLGSRPAQLKLEGEAVWVWHRDIGYVVLEQDGVLKVDAEKRQGNWSSIGTSDVPAEATVFTAYIDHGSRIDNAGYAYINLPGSDVERTRAVATSPFVEILERNERVHAVRHLESGHLFGAFLQQGALELNDSLRIDVDQPCLVLLANENGYGVAYLTDPLLAAGQIHLKIGDDFSKDVRMPDGDRLGSTVRVPLSVPFEALR